jgi:cell division septation protein DedD
MGSLSIQLGAFREESSANDVMRKLQEIGYSPYLETRTLETESSIYRVRLKGYASMGETSAIVAELKKQGFHDVFINWLEEWEFAPVVSATRIDLKWS